MNARRLRQEVERLKRDTGWQDPMDAEVEAAEQRQRTRFEVIQYELLRFRTLIPIMNDIGQNCSNVTADYERARTWLDEEDTAEQWRADHELLVEHEIKRYGEERDIARREGWGGSWADMIEHFIELWERFIPEEGRAKERREKVHELWREAPDGRGVLTENTWQEKHRAELDPELATEEPRRPHPMFDEWRAEAARCSKPSVAG
jgi:hypothetical protein